MLWRLFRLFHRDSADRVDATHRVELPTLTREDVASLLVVEEGLPQVDWKMAHAWIARRALPAEGIEDLRRAIAAECRRQVQDGA